MSQNTYCVTGLNIVSRFHNSKNEVVWFPMGSGGNPYFVFERTVPKDGVMIWAGVIGDGRKLQLVIFPPGTWITAAIYMQYVISIYV